MSACAVYGGFFMYTLQACPYRKNGQSRLRYVLYLAAFVCFLLLFLTGCGRERLIQPHDVETGAFCLASESSRAHPEEAVQTQAQAAFQQFTEQIFREELSAASTLDLHYTLAYPERFGIEAGTPTLGSYSLTGLIEASAAAEDLKAQLEEFDPSLLSPKQQVLYDTLKESLNTTLMAKGLELYEQPLAPTIGTQAQLPILLSEYAFYSREDVDDYLALIEETDEYFRQLLVFENQKAEAGLAPSDSSIDGIIASCESYLIDPENNFLTETFETRLAELESSVPLTQEEKDGCRMRHAAAIRDHFIPAYQLLIDGMNNLKGKGIQDGGLCGLKDGRQYYEYLVKSGPGLSYSIPELKKALAERMEKDLETLGRLFEENPSPDVMDTAFSLADPQMILEDLKQQMTGRFPEIPDCTYEIRYVPQYLEETLSPAFYLTAPADNLNRNIIYINNGYSDSTDSLYTTLAHEGFPGHLYQTVYSRFHAESPLAAILSCSGANEGWATYVENLACQFDNGLPEGAGQYRACLRSFSLCAYGLLDIGIHYDGWSKEQAAQFIQTWFQAEESVTDEIWQTILDAPANYLEYAGGYVELMEMREEAEQRLGDDFSEKEFHTFYLDLGPVPFSVARKYFSLWLSQHPGA